MKNIRTDAERAEAVTRLRENKNKCRLGQTAYPEINAMIEVIKNNWHEETILEHFMEDSNEQDQALVALDYLRGVEELEDITYPEA